MSSTNFILPPTTESSTTPVTQTHLNIVQADEVPLNNNRDPQKRGIHMQCLCSDRDHNEETEAFHLITSIVCDHDLALPKLSGYLKPFPRYIVDLKPDRDGPGRWITVLIEDDRVIRFFTPNFAELMTFLQCLCSVCGIPNHQCMCPAIVNADAEWCLYKSSEVKITDDRELNRATYLPHHVVYANVQFTHSVTQSEKMYTHLLNEPDESEPFVKLAEDVITLFTDFRKSRHIPDLLVASLTFVRSVTGRSTAYMLRELLNNLLITTLGESAVQSDGHWTETLSDLYENYNRAKNSLLCERLKKVFNHIIAHSIYHKLGIEVDQKLFEQFEEQKIRINLAQCATFIDASLGLITFLLKQGRQCMLLGSIEPMYISCDTTGDWFNRAKRTLMRFESVCNPNAIGVNIHELLGELSAVLNEGKSLRKFVSRHDVNNFYVSKTVVDLERAYNSYIVACAACSTRRTPFGVCIYGSPGIGKGSILDILSTYDSEIRGKPKDKSYVYMHPSDSEYFDLFKTWMHTIVFEDVAQLNPSKLQGVDPSVQFFMKAINNQPWCPPQAALEDKGKTPVMVDTVFVTSNTLDLNIPAFYQHSYAPMRRFPLHIEPIVRPEFRRDGENVIDFKKAKSIPGQYDDFWEFKIRVPEEKGKNPSYAGQFVEKPELHCKDMKDLLSLYKQMCLAHHQKEDSMLQKYADAALVVICERCASPAVYCECGQDETQAKTDYFDGFMSQCDQVERKCDDQCSSCYSQTPDSERDSTDTQSWLHTSHMRSLPAVEEEEMKEEEKSQNICSCSNSTSSYSSANSMCPDDSFHQETVPAASWLSWLPKWLVSRSTSVSLSAQEEELRQQLGDELFLEAKDAMCAGYKFGQLRFPDAEIGAWRDTRIPRRPPRNGTNRLFRDFLNRFGNRKVQAITYLNLHINDSLEHGYTDGEIALDFLRWCKNTEERKALEELDGLVDVIMCSDEMKKVRPGSVLDYLVQCVIYCYFHWSWFRWTVNSIGSKAFIRRRAMPLLRPLLVRSHNQQYFMRQLGGYLDDRIGALPSWGQSILVALSATAALATFIMIGSSLMRTARTTKLEVVEISNDEAEEKDQSVEDLDEEQNPYELQMGKFPQPLHENRKTNPWVVPERIVTSLDFSTKRITDAKALQRNLAYNTLVVTHRGRDVADFVTRFRILALNEHTFITNNHSLECGDDFDLTVHFNDIESGDAVRFRLKEKQIQRIPERDIAIIRTHCIPNRFKRIQNNFPRRSSAMNSTPTSSRRTWMVRVTNMNSIR